MMAPIMSGALPGDESRDSSDSGAGHLPIQGGLYTSPPVWNEAENSFQGGYTVAPGVDPNPPAFLRGEQMRVGQGHGDGLVNAAGHSPALAVCGDAGSGDGGDGGDGGGGGVILS
jgi:hypothetical protein